MASEAYERVAQAHTELKESIGAPPDTGAHELDRTMSREPRTTVPAQTLKSLGEHLLQLPDDFNLHRKLKPLLERRREALEAAASVAVEGGALGGDERQVGQAVVVEIAGRGVADAADSGETAVRDQCRAVLVIDAYLEVTHRALPPCTQYRPVLPHVSTYHVRWYRPMSSARV